MPASEYDAIVVGGGAAGIAAARRLREARLDTLIVEARDRLGGRAWTIADPAGNALDLGCGWLHSAERNPWREIAETQGRTIDRTPPPWARTSPQPGFSAKEQAAFRSALQDFRARLDAVDFLAPDRSAATFLEPHGRWNGLLNAVSSYYSGAELDRLSAQDFARYEDDGVNWRIVEGYGTTIVAYAVGLPVQLNCTVKCIDRTGSRLRVETDAGTIAASAVIVTLPSNVLAHMPDFFRPALPEKTEAAAGLPLGLADKLFLSLAEPEEFAADSRLFGRTDRTETATYHVRPFGRPQIEVYFGGSLAAELERGESDAFADFAVRELTALFGGDFAARVKPVRSHSWGQDPLALGSYSYAQTGKAGARGVLAESVEDRLFFAGEACSASDYSTAHGAYKTGIAAAERAIASLGGRRVR